MFASLLALQLVAAPAPSTVAERPKLLVLDLRDDGAGPQLVRLLRDALTAHIAREDVAEVLSTEDVRRLVDLETQKMECGDDASAACLAEIGSALGARYIVYGSVGTLGTSTVVNMSLAETATGKTLARALVQNAVLERLANEVGAAMHEMLEEAGLTHAPPASSGPSAWPWLLGGTASVVAGAGMLAGGVVLANGADAVVADTTSSKAAKDDAELARAGFVGGAVLGGVVAATGVALIAMPWVLE